MHTPEEPSPSLKGILRNKGQPGPIQTPTQNEAVRITSLKRPRSSTETSPEDEMEYWVRKFQMKQRYWKHLTLCRKVLRPDSIGATEDAVDHSSNTQFGSGKDAKIKLDRFLENIARIMRMLEEDPNVDKARRLDALDRVEKHIKTIVLPVVNEIVRVQVVKQSHRQPVPVPLCPVDGTPLVPRPMDFQAARHPEIPCEQHRRVLSESSVKRLETAIEHKARCGYQPVLVVSQDDNSPAVYGGGMGLVPPKPFWNKVNLGCPAALGNS
jgi:hypothetical protein